MKEEFIMRILISLIIIFSGINKLYAYFPITDAVCDPGELDPQPWWSKSERIASVSVMKIKR